MIKKAQISVILAIITVLAVSFFIRDWFVFYNCGAVEQCLADSSYFQHYTKFAVTCMINILVLFFGRKCCICKRDRRLIQLGMLCCLCADVCFKILHNAARFIEHSADYMLLGICFFMVFQTILIYRHTRVSDTDERVPWIITVPLAVMFILNALYVFNVFETPMVPIVVVYGAFLICSLIAGFRVSKTGYFPTKNATLIKRGMVLFFLGDVCVGLSLATGPDHSTQEVVATIANNLVWPFYVPALLCLVLSGYRNK